MTKRSAYRLRIRSNDLRYWTLALITEKGSKGSPKALAQASGLLIPKITRLRFVDGEKQKQAG
jgi:hypothetical protein